MPPARHTLLSLSTRSSTFFADATFSFADGLNTFMAGRGCGKTSVLYLLRFALGSAIPASYAKAFDAHIKDVLGPGTATVTVRTQHGVVYAISRACGEEPKVRNAAGELVDVSLDGELFRIDAYAAKEIEQMADDPVQQLALLDRLAPPEETRRLRHAQADVERRLALSGAEVDRLAAEIATDEAREGELPALVEALKGLALVDPAAGGDGGPLANAEARRRARGREHAAMSELAAEIANSERALAAFARETQRRLAAAAHADLEREREPIGPLFACANDAARHAAGSVETAAARLHEDLTRAAEAVSAPSRALRALHDAEDEAYKALVVRADADRERAVQREALHRRRDELEALARRLAERRRERDRKHAAHTALLGERAAILEQRYVLRDQLARDITLAASAQVRVTVKRGGIVQRYQALLHDVLQGSGLPRELIDQIADGIPPDELYALALREDEAPIVLIDRMKSGKTARAHKVIAALRASGRLREIEMAPLEDLPLIELCVDGEHQPSSRVSTGQKCTAILPILLLPSANPLVIDQIEDHLDNRFIFEVLVKTLLEAKKSRQFVLATHNANIPVLADAERVFELTAKDRVGSLAAHGTVEEMRERIELVLEGGRDAFLRRGERYGHLPARPGSAAVNAGAGAGAEAE